MFRICVFVRGSDVYEKRSKFESTMMFKRKCILTSVCHRFFTVSGGILGKNIDEKLMPKKHRKIFLAKSKRKMLTTRGPFRPDLLEAPILHGVSQAKVAVNGSDQRA